MKCNKHPARNSHPSNGFAYAKIVLTQPKYQAQTHGRQSHAIPHQGNGRDANQSTQNGCETKNNHDEVKVKGAE